MESPSYDQLASTPANEVDYKSAFRYPLSSFLCRDGHWTAYGSDEEIKEAFDQLETIYAYQEGENDEQAWILLGRTSDDDFVFMQASCDYTGFNCRGGGTVAVSDDWSTMWNMYMTESIRDFILRKNKLPAFSLDD